MIKLNLNYKIRSSDDVIENIEKYFRIGNKSFKSVNNCCTLMEYYHTRGNREKAIEYANKLLNYNNDFTRYKDMALEIINASYEENENEIEE